MTRSKPWTERRPKVLVASEASTIRAAAVFGRSINHIRERARKLGTPFPTVHEGRRKFAEISSRSANEEDAL
jgi:hypothetical protein